MIKRVSYLRGSGRQGPFRESGLRSLYKSISWRVIGSIDTVILASLLTGGEVWVATQIGIAEVVTKTVLYFLHERGWSRVTFGKESRISVRYRRKHPLGRMPSERHGRSALKTATWRIIASLDTTLLSWFFTGSLGIAAAIGSIEIVTKLVLYYGHERLWARLRFGLRNTPGQDLPRATQLPP